MESPSNPQDISNTSQIFIMKFSQAFLLAAISASAVQAASHLTIRNYCKYNLFYSRRSAPSRYSDITIAPGATYTTSEVSINAQAIDIISHDSRFRDYAAVKFVSNGSLLRYDLSLERCNKESCPFISPGFSLKPTDAKCPIIDCPLAAAASAACSAAFEQSIRDHPKLECSAESDLSFSACVS